MSRETRRAWAVVVSALVAPLGGAQPTGSPLIDLLWAALLGGLVAYLATWAKRGPLLAAAAAAVLSARSGLAVLLAVTAVVAAATSTRHLRRRAVLARGLAGGAATASVLAASDDHAALFTAAALVAVIVPTVWSALKTADALQRRVLKIAAIGLGALAFGACVSAAVGTAVSARDLEAGATSFRAGLAAARQGDVERAAAELADAQLAVEDARRSIDRWGAFARLVPGAAQQVAAVSEVLDDVGEVAGQASRTASLTQSAALEMRGGRIDVDAVADLANPLARLVRTLTEVVREADGHLDAPLLPPLSDRLEEIREEAVRALQDARLAEQAALVAPDILGADEPRRYLLLFTSPSEARGRFGFPGSFAEVILDDGRIQLGEQGTTSAELVGVPADQSRFALTDDLLRPYIAFGSTRLMLNVTIPPDFPTVAESAAAIWESSGRAPLDGVLRFDPASLAALVRFTGPVTVADVPEPLGPENLEQFLIFDQYVQFPREQAPRREVLETVAEVTVDRLQRVDLPAPRTLVEVFGPLVRDQRFHVFATGREEQDLLTAVGLDGALERTASDELLVANVNAGGNKIDAFLRRSFEYDVAVDGRDLVGRLDVRLENLAPAEDLPFYVIGSSTRPPLPMGTNRTTLLVLAQGRAETVLVDGRPVPARIEPSGGRWLHQVTVDIPPGATVQVGLELVGTLATDGYSLSLLPGGGVTPDEFTVTVATQRGAPVTHRGKLGTLTYFP